MANQFTYLGALEEMKAKLQWEAPDCSLTEMEERFRFMGILYCLAATIDHFEKATKRAEESIIIRELADVDFDYWTKINNWDIPEWLTDDTLREAHIWRSWTIHNNREYINDKLSNQMTAVLPEPPKLVEYDDAKARADMRTFLQLFQGVCFNSQQLRYAIYQGIQALIETLQTLHTTLYKHHTDEEYAAWYNELNMEFTSLLIQDLSRKYANAVNQRLNGLSRDWLMERFSDAASVLWDTQYMQERKKACTNDECKNQPIYFDIPNLSKDQHRKFFHVLLEVGTFTENGYIVDKPAQAGRCFYLLYLNNIKEQAIIDFFTFQITAKLISNDLPNYPAEKQSKKKMKTEKDEDLRYMTFQKRGIVDGHLAMVSNHLVQNGWLDKVTQPDDFCDLFSGKTKFTKIKWTGKVGLGMLVYLVNKMVELKKIIVPKGYTVNTILQTHVIDKHDKYISGLNKTTVTDKHLPIVQECIDFLFIEIDSN